MRTRFHTLYCCVLLFGCHFDGYGQVFTVQSVFTHSVVAVVGQTRDKQRTQQFLDLDFRGSEDPETGLRVTLEVHTKIAVLSL